MSWSCYNHPGAKNWVYPPPGYFPDHRDTLRDALTPFNPPSKCRRLLNDTARCRLPTWNPCCPPDDYVKFRNRQPRARCPTLNERDNYDWRSSSSSRCSSDLIRQRQDYYHETKRRNIGGSHFERDSPWRHRDPNDNDSESCCELPDDPPCCNGNVVPRRDPLYPARLRRKKLKIPDFDHFQLHHEPETVAEAHAEEALMPTAPEVAEPQQESAPQRSSNDSEYMVVKTTRTITRKKGETGGMVEVKQEPL